MTVADDLFPDKKNVLKEHSLSALTVPRRIEDMGEQSYSTLKDRTRAFQCSSLAFDESNDVSDTAQFLIFVLKIDTRLEVTEELAAIKSLKGTTTGEYIINKLCECLDMLQLKWDNLKCVTTDG
ncbi:unnamed protein product [Ixodes pacificus]